MRVFVSESVVGGGWCDGNPPPSLTREGHSMWAAVLEDFANIRGCHVVTTRDVEQPCTSVDRVKVIAVRGPDEERRCLIECAQLADVVLLVAPEIGNQLMRRIELVAQVAPEAMQLNSDRNTTELCSDKLRLAEFLIDADIRTPPSRTFNLSHGTRDFHRSMSYPAILKPRFGAGSTNVRLLYRDPESDQDGVAGTPETLMIVQPFIEGRAVSIAVLRPIPGGAYDILPLAEQILSDDGRFEYRGGRLPLTVVATPIHRVVDRVMELLPGLCGYAGFDFVIPHDEPDCPTLIEINPRLTTSYLGYRALAEQNLMERLLSRTPWTGPLHWKPGQVHYTPDGQIRRSQEAGRAAQ